MSVSCSPSLRAAAPRENRTIFRKICGAWPVLRWYNKPMSTILVPVDFSEETPEVIECAAMLARRNRSELVLMHVSAGGGESVAGGSPAEEAGETVEKLARLERYLREEGFQVSTAVRAGEPARAIVEFGGSIKADCIIMGRHDHGADATGAKSPVTSCVESTARCTVVSVP
jgi:nucleotide-binding universal stress UspA family protein